MKSVGRGQWGEGFSGNTIKDTWTKPRGWVEGWGENADNCNLTTIKKKQVNKIFSIKKKKKEKEKCGQSAHSGRP